MGKSSAESAVNLGFPSVVAHSCNLPVLITEFIYDLPDKRPQVKSEYDSIHFQHVSLNSLQLRIP